MSFFIFPLGLLRQNCENRRLKCYKFLQFDTHKLGRYDVTGYRSQLNL
jgi:hypothetical protein